MLIQQPLVATNRNGQYDVICTVSGGGLSGQRAPCATARQGFDLLRAGAARRAQESRLPHRDPRVVERKKYGRAKARRSFQFFQALIGANRDSDRARRWRAFSLRAFARIVGIAFTLWQYLRAASERF